MGKRGLIKMGMKLKRFSSHASPYVNTRYRPLMASLFMRPLMFSRVRLIYSCWSLPSARSRGRPLTWIKHKLWKVFQGTNYVDIQSVAPMDVPMWLYQQLWFPIFWYQGVKELWLIMTLSALGLHKFCFCIILFHLLQSMFSHAKMADTNIFEL